MKCFYHNDLDGRCAGSIIAQFENNYNPDDFYEVDYVIDLMPLLEEIKVGEKVYFVDYSFKENTKWILHKLISMNCDVIWIDHHTSSLELERGIGGIRREKISGAALTYMHLYKCGFDEIPYYIKLVSDYDCWINNFDPDTTHFKIGIETESYNALDSVWKLLSGKTDEFSATSTLFTLRDKGATIKKYIDMDNAQYLKQYGYETIIDGHKCLAVNKKTNSWIFGEKYNEYPVVMVWAFNGDKFSYSIFSGDKSVDCSKIAEKFGGGGHKGAAGFSSDRLLFTKS